METHIHLPVKSQFRNYVTLVWEILGKRDVNELIFTR
jgi:hypothetical protein